MRTTWQRSACALAASLFLFSSSPVSLGLSRAQEGNTAAKKLDSAISALRHISQDKLSEKDKDQKSKEIEAAWAIIRAAGKTGIARLKQELQSANAANEKDDFFKLNVSCLLWQMGGFDEAESIAQIWNSTPLDAQYLYVFYTALAAARMQDPRAIPMLRACLRDKKGKVFVALHQMDVKWPLTIQFLWGSFGAKGLPVLARILETSKDPVELESAIVLLTESHYLEALPASRKLADSADKSVRAAAIRGLGQYGHPEDYELLAAGLKSNDPEELTAYAFALYEYDDLRAVPLLTPLLKTENDALRREVIGALAHLVSVESYEALGQHCASATSDEAKRKCFSEMSVALEDVPVSADSFPNMPTRAKAELVYSIRRKTEEEYVLQPGDRRFTRQDLVAAIEDWKKEHRLDTKRFGWVEPKHILSIATAGDLDSLIDVRAAVFARLSDECLYEVRTLDQIIRRLGRSRYRKAVGLAEKVEAP